MKIYIINLDQSTDRLALQNKQFARLNLSFERLPAVSVADISKEFYLTNMPHSIIGAIKNTIDFQPTLRHKLGFKKNRIFTQIKLGIKTIKALLLGEKREILVNRDKFL
ncbi:MULTISPECIES: glycosyltransferase family 25 protein [unclassified Moraxella]|uniref:glycosyltransferase family 25 protein n=1 Tax=unclassified Moraxella TaxID=2685852 RepID=UPI002B413684|nr:MULTISPECIES: glycosyltransferase family 25 protein [unclassified Moraxella]